MVEKLPEAVTQVLTISKSQGRHLSLDEAALLGHLELELARLKQGVINSDPKSRLEALQQMSVLSLNYFARALGGQL